LKIKKINSKTAKAGIIAALITAAAGLVFVVLTQVNFLGDLVVDQIRKAVNDKLGIELVMPALSGNPVVGFKGKEMSFVRSDEKLLTIDKVEIKLSLQSLLKNSPRVSALVIEGLSTDYDSLLKMLPERSGSSGTDDIPINKIIMNKVRVSSQWGLLELDDSSLELRGLKWFAPALRGRFRDIPFSVFGVVRKEEESWLLDGFSARLDEGSAKISGKVYPVPDFKADVEDADLRTIASIFPNFSKYGVMGKLTAKIEMSVEGRDIFTAGEGTIKKAVLRRVPLEELTAKWRYEDGVLDISLDESKVFESSLRGSMKLDTRTPGKYLELKINTHDLRFADWTDKITHEIAGNAAMLKGSITAMEADLKGPLDALVGKVEIAPSNVAYNKMKFTAMQGKVFFEGKPSGRLDLSALNEGREIRLAGTVSIADGVPVDLKLNTRSIKLEELGKAVSELEKFELKGTADVSAKIGGDISALKVKADISSPSAEIKGIGKLTAVKASPEYDVSLGTLRLANASLLWNGAYITASGNVKDIGGTPEFSLGGAIKNASLGGFHDTLKVLKTLKISGDASGAWALRGKTDSPEVLLKLRVPNGRFMDIVVSKFYTEMAYSPDRLDFRKMDGDIAGGRADLKGKVDLPRKTSGGSSPVRWEFEGQVRKVDISVLNGLFGMKQDIEGSCSGQIKIGNDGSGIRWKTDISSDGLRWKEFSAEKATGSLSGGPGEIRIGSVKVNFLRGEHVLTGNIIPSPSGRPFSESTLDLKVASKNINMYELLRKHLPVVRGVQGLINSEVLIKGTVGKPLLSGSGTLAPFRYRGFLLPMVDVAFNGSLTDIKVSEAKARLEHGELTANGRIYMENGKWHGAIDTKGKDIDLRQVGAYLPDQFRRRFGGNASFKFTGRGEVDDFSGEGSFSSERMRFLGLRITNVNAPFYISDGYAVMEDVKAETNGGTVTGGLAMDIAKSSWGGNLTVMSADVAPMIKQAFPSLSGSISGKGDLKIRAGGEPGRMSTVNAAGVLFLRDGEISGFEAVEAAKKYTKGKPLLFKTIQTAFTLDEGYLTILPGSQAVAPSGDPVYRYVMLDGLINKKKEMSLFAMGKVNIQALNALLGALQGIINVGMEFTGELDRNALLQNFLGGVLSGFTRTDFRFVTLNVNGTVGSPSFSNVKVDKSEQMTSPRNVIPKSASDPNEKDYQGRDTVFRLKFEIPVGPGISYTNGNDISGQIIEQTFGNILQGIDFGN